MRRMPAQAVVAAAGFKVFMLWMRYLTAPREAIPIMAPRLRGSEAPRLRGSTNSLYGVAGAYRIDYGDKDSAFF